MSPATPDSPNYALRNLICSINKDELSNAEYLEQFNMSLREAFEHANEGVANVGQYKSMISYGFISGSAYPGHSHYGFMIGGEIFLQFLMSRIISDHEPIPSAVLAAYPDITSDQWEASIRWTTVILGAFQFHVEVSASERISMRKPGNRSGSMLQVLRMIHQGLSANEYSLEQSNSQLKAAFAYYTELAKKWIEHTLAISYGMLPDDAQSEHVSHGFVVDNYIHLPGLLNKLLNIEELPILVRDSYPDIIHIQWNAAIQLASSIVGAFDYRTTPV